jgi:16S rRNA (guanine527-N7)-methyltransferase
VGTLDRLLVALEREADPPTTVRRASEAVGRHVADSLSGLEVPELARARTVADIGAGAGFPGLVLAAALPAAKADLIESSRRKAAVIERLAAAAGIRNATVVVERAESWAAQRPGAYDAVTARALGPLAVILEYAAPLLSEAGVAVAWKGARDRDEEVRAGRAAEILNMAPVRTLPARPFPGARQRHLHVFRKLAPTPPRFPRRPGVAARRPLA